MPPEKRTSASNSASSSSTPPRAQTPGARRAAQRAAKREASLSDSRKAAQKNLQRNVTSGAASARPLLDPQGLYGTRTAQRRRAVRRRRRAQNVLLFVSFVALLVFGIWRWRTTRHSASGASSNLQLSAQPSAPPTFSGASLLVPTFDGNLLSIDNAAKKASAVSSSRTLLSADFPLRVQPLATGSSVVVVSEDGTVFFLDNDTVRWKWRSSSSVTTRPVVVRVLDSAAVQPAAATGQRNFALLPRKTTAPPSQIVVTGNDAGMIVALNVRNGAPVWKRDLGAPIGNGLSALGTKIYVPLLSGAKTRGGVVCLDARSGAVLWRAETGAACLPTPAVGATLAAGKGVRVFVTADNGSVICLDANSGKRLWKIFVRPLPANAQDEAVVLRGEPLLKSYRWGARLFIGGNDGALRCLEVRQGRELWRYEGVTSLLQRPLSLRTGRDDVQNDFVVLGMGNQINALDAKSGDVSWQAQPRGEVAGFALKDQTLWSISRDGLLERFEIQ
jgi:outer membrane protein assembly factor BamB